MRKYTREDIAEDYEISLEDADAWVSLFGMETVQGYKDLKSMMHYVLNTENRLESAYSYKLITEESYYDALRALNSKEEY